MQVAALLSDLTSLSVCDHTAALSLVSVHRNLPPNPNPNPNNNDNSNNNKNPTKDTSSASPPKSQIQIQPQTTSARSTSNPDPNAASNADPDPDLQRAIDLVALHGQKMQWQDEGLDGELVGLREDVERIRVQL